MENIFVWLKFFVSAGLVIFSGIKLTKCVDVLSDEFNLAKVWAGMMLLGVVTSLPELTASISSVSLLGAPNLALGNITGSVNFNLMIVAIMDFMYRKGSITSQLKIKKSYQLSAVFFSILSVIVVIEIFLALKMPLFSIGPLSLGSVLIIILYVWGTRRIFLSETQQTPTARIEKKISQKGKIAILKFCVFSCIVVLSSISLSGACDQIAIITGLGRTFVGTTFLAIVTSLPEIVVSISALKMNSIDLAFGNIFGSNMSNVLILGICDFFYVKKPMMASVSPTHILMMSLSVVLTTILIFGIQKRCKKTFFGFGIDVILMMVCFAAGMKFLYDLR